jgi:hypothetical protein
MKIMKSLLDRWIGDPQDIWIALNRMLLDYEHGVPRITDSNRLKQGIWCHRTQLVEQELARALNCSVAEVSQHLERLMYEAYAPSTQRMNPVGIAFACAIVDLSQRFGAGGYTWKLEARIGVDVFPSLTNFRRQSIEMYY